jgi:hypothetical protein
MATIGDIRDGLRTRLSTIYGLRVYTRWPDNPALPAALVRRSEGPTRTTFDRRAVVTMEITVAVVIADLVRAQDALEEYTDLTGANSIMAALEADETLGGAAEMLLIGSWDGDSDQPLAGVSYLGASLPVEVHYVV